MARGRGVAHGGGKVTPTVVIHNQYKGKGGTTNTPRPKEIPIVIWDNMQPSAPRPGTKYGR